MAVNVPFTEGFVQECNAQGLSNTQAAVLLELSLEKSATAAAQPQARSWWGGLVDDANNLAEKGINVARATRDIASRGWEGAKAGVKAVKQWGTDVKNSLKPKVKEPESPITQFINQTLDRGDPLMRYTVERRSRELRGLSPDPVSPAKLTPSKPKTVAAQPAAVPAQPGLITTQQPTETQLNSFFTDSQGRPYTSADFDVIKGNAYGVRRTFIKNKKTGQTMRVPEGTRIPQLSELGIDYY